MQAQEKILNLQRRVDIKNKKLWCGDFYIHKQTKIRVELGCIAPDFVVLVGDKTLPDDFKLIWDKQEFIQQFELEEKENDECSALGATNVHQG